MLRELAQGLTKGQQELKCLHKRSANSDSHQVCEATSLLLTYITFVGDGNDHLLSNVC